MTTETDPAYEAFLANIVRILEKNGYPGARVSLPLERMYEVADAKGLNFNRALALLEARGVLHEKTTEKVIFRSRDAAPPPAESPLTMEGIPEDMRRRAEELMKRLSPEELRQMEELARSMTDAEKGEWVERARALGLLR